MSISLKHKDLEPLGQCQCIVTGWAFGFVTFDKTGRSPAAQDPDLTAQNMINQDAGLRKQLSTSGRPDKNLCNLTNRAVIWRGVLSVGAGTCTSSCRTMHYHSSPVTGLLVVYQCGTLTEEPEEMLWLRRSESNW